MRTRRPRTGWTAVGTESLVDVLSNTVGGLALLCIVAALDSGNLRWRLFISEERPARTEPVVLAVDGGRIAPFDTGELAEVLPDLSVGAHRLAPTANLAYEAVVDKQSADEAQIRLIPALEVSGDPIERLLAGQGDVAERLMSVDATTSHIFLFISEDAFGRYLELRSFFRARGFQVGWAMLSETLEFRWGGGGAGLPTERFVEVGG